MNTNNLLIKNQLLSKFLNNWYEIIQDTYGNYAFQALIETWEIDMIEDIINNICDNIVSLSIQKYSSCVVEKCLQYLDEDRFVKMLNKLFDKVNFDILFKSKFGYFVLIKAITICPYDYKKMIKEKILKYKNSLGYNELSRFSTLVSIL
jgi:hypothetical protein